MSYNTNFEHVYIVLKKLAKAKLGQIVLTISFPEVCVFKTNCFELITFNLGKQGTISDDSRDKFKKQINP